MKVTAAILTACVCVAGCAVHPAPRASTASSTGSAAGPSPKLLLSPATFSFEKVDEPRPIATSVISGWLDEAYFLEIFDDGTYESTRLSIDDESTAWASIRRDTDDFVERGRWTRLGKSFVLSDRLGYQRCITMTPDLWGLCVFETDYLAVIAPSSPSN